MRRFIHVGGLLVLALAVALALGCGSDDTPTVPDDDDDDIQPDPLYMPVVPVPSAPTQNLPNQSTKAVVGVSNPIAEFEPTVQRVRMMIDDGSLVWRDMNRHVILACGDYLPENTGDPAANDRSYISAVPRLLHQRYWRKIKQVTLEPGSSYERSETITYGSSTYHEESREFSRTMGVEVEAGGSWGAFSASVTASYEQTETESEVEAVTFSEESSFTETYSVGPDPDHTIVYAIWQLVDTFTFVDADTVRIHESPTLQHVEMPAIADIEFANETVIYQSVTRFD